MIICRHCRRKFDESKYGIDGYCCLYHKSIAEYSFANYDTNIKRLDARSAYEELKRIVTEIESSTFQILFNSINSDEEVLKEMLDNNKLMNSVINRAIPSAGIAMVANIRIEYLQPLLSSTLEKMNNGYIKNNIFFMIFDGFYESKDQERNQIIRAMVLAKQLKF